MNDLVSICLIHYLLLIYLWNKVILTRNLIVLRLQRRATKMVGPPVAQSYFHIPGEN